MVILSFSFVFYYNARWRKAAALFIPFCPIVEKGVGIHFIEGSFVDADGAFAVWTDDLVALHLDGHVPFADARFVAA